MQDPFFLKSKLVNITLFLFFLAFGVYLRFYHLEDQSYWMDEGYTVNAVISINEKGISVLDSGKPYNCPIYCYPTAFIVKKFGDSPVYYRLLASISGVLLIILIYFISTAFYNKNIALISTFFISTSYYQIAWSREARWYTLFSLLFWIASFSYYFALKNKNYKVFIITGISTILAILTHQLGYLLPIIFILWFIYEKRRVEIRKNFLKVTILVFFSLTMILLLDYLSGVNFFSNNLNSLGFHYVLPYYLLFYLYNYLPFIFLTVYYFFTKDKFEEINKYLLLNLLVYIIPIGTLTQVVQYRYLFHLTPVLFLISSVCIYNLISKISTKTTRWILILFAILLYFTLGYGVYKHNSFYFLESDSPKFKFLNRQHISYTPQPNWNSAYAIIAKNITSSQIIVSSHPQFNKIFLKQAGYWIRYPYLGINSLPEVTVNDKEYYVNATTIDNLNELINITKNNHGYIIFDYMSTDIGRIPLEITNYIKENFKLFYFEEVNEYSKIWVYYF